MASAATYLNLPSTHGPGVKRLKLTALIAGLFLCGSFCHYIVRAANFMHIGHSAFSLSSLHEIWIRTICFMAAAFVLEYTALGWERSSLRYLFSGGRKARDALFALLWIFRTVSWFAIAASFGFAWVISQAAASLSQFHLVARIDCLPIELVLLIVVRSFLFYWQHRLMHSVGVLWQFHKFHHSAEEMTILNNLRETPLTAAVNTALTVLPITLLGDPVYHMNGIMDSIALALYVSYTSAVEMNNYFQHSQWQATYGSWGRYLFASPVYHRIHHSILPEHRDRNFASDFTIWDKLFGTQIDPELYRGRDIPVGLDDNAYNRSSVLFDYFVRPGLDAINYVLGQFLTLIQSRRRVRDGQTPDEAQGEHVLEPLADVVSPDGFEPSAL